MELRKQELNSLDFFRTFLEDLETDYGYYLEYLLEVCAYPGFYGIEVPDTVKQSYCNYEELENIDADGEIGHFLETGTQ